MMSNCTVGTHVGRQITTCISICT